MYILLQLYLTFKFVLGICPGDKIPSLDNPMWCSCPPDAIEGASNKCIVCTGDGEVPNDEQSECVGMLD